MKGYARIIASESQIWIRFERVGRKRIFNILLNTFRSTFPFAEWDEPRKAWKMPITHLGQIAEFCNQTFGTGNLQIHSYDTTFSGTRQLELLRPD